MKQCEFHVKFNMNISLEYTQDKKQILQHNLVIKTN